MSRTHGKDLRWAVGRSTCDGLGFSIFHTISSGNRLLPSAFHALPGECSLTLPASGTSASPPAPTTSLLAGGDGGTTLGRGITIPGSTARVEYFRLISLLRRRWTDRRVMRSSNAFYQHACPPPAASACSRVSGHRLPAERNQQ